MTKLIKTKNNKSNRQKKCKEKLRNNEINLNLSLKKNINLSKMNLNTENTLYGHTNTISVLGR